MAHGPGKYDKVCTDVREKTNAKAAIVLVIDGDSGTGFSCQGAPDTTAQLPGILETMARQIRESLN